MKECSAEGQRAETVQMELTKPVQPLLLPVETLGLGLSRKRRSRKRVHKSMPKPKAQGIARERNAWFFKPEFLESNATIALIPELVFSTKKLESY
jgi:hypothetical protein